uniref:Metalloendopeptidase n=1 Tax=Syphacia muris TaxID=451379 RepID=A0A0N5AFE9_9BILA
MDSSKCLIAAFVVCLATLTVTAEQFVLPQSDERRLRIKRHIHDDIENARSLLQGFLKLSADIPLTPTRRFNYSPQPISYRYIDRTEYAANKRILRDVFETDLVLTVPQIKRVISDFKNRNNEAFKSRSKRKAIIGNSFRWPNKTVYYYLKENDEEWRNLIREGIRKWQSETCIKFKEWTDQKDHIYVFRGAGCYSSVGRIGGRQYASIGYGCENGGIVAHELGHALGFWHEQSRPDRDKYININEDYILEGTKGNFAKRSDIDQLKTPYDFGSVMHYGPQAFTNNYNYVTIETKDHRFQHTIGQRKDLSFIDIKEANILYCSDVCKTKLKCLHGGYEDPRNCNICKCPPGLSGRRCQGIPRSTYGCGGELEATDRWQTLKNKVVGDCYWKIKAPGDKVYLEVLDAHYKCDSSCSDNYLEIKHRSDLQLTGFRQCCNAAPGAIVSQSDSVYIMSRSSSAPSEFELRYITAAATENLPKAPLAQWNGNGGITGLIAAENGVDGTIEQYLLKRLPNALRNFGGLSRNPILGIGEVIRGFLQN